MTASLERKPPSPSRRALLAGAIGGLGALAASAIGRPSVAQGHDVDDVLLGGANTATTVTSITNTPVQGDALQADGAGSGSGVVGSSGSGKGVWGDSSSFIGAEGSSGTYWGVYGVSGSHIGVYGSSGATDRPATFGWSRGNSTGVLGYTNDGSGSPQPVGKAKTGVYGYAAQDSGAKGVWGETTSGHGVHGTATSGFAGYFAGKVYTTKFVEMTEISAPAAPGANKARLFLRVNGLGKTQLCVRFQSGSVQVIKTEP